jgi:predicted membrane-bound spermidine synthase
MACFMLGMTLGAWFSSVWVRAGRATWRRLVILQEFLCVYPLAVIAFVVLASGSGIAATPLLSALLFSVLALVAGVAGGLQFPMAAALYSCGSSSAGTLYGLDLFGSCLGALAVSSILVPLLGLGGVCWMLSALAALGLVLLLAICREARAK